jgi:protein-L-isoaspartate(D-aspartate) O-methyltransferase
VTSEPLAESRERMLREHLERRGIRSPAVLGAFARVPRDRFVPAPQLPAAYDDHPIEIGFGQTISQPYMVATMVEALGLEAGAKVLDVGTGSGYQAAILCEMGYAVHSVERIPALAEDAGRRLASLGYAVRIRVGDGSLGWPEEAPFDGIVVGAGAPDLPIALVRELAEGLGRLVIPVGSEDEQSLLLVRREEGRVKRQSVCRCRFVKLIGTEGWSGGT